MRRATLSISAWKSAKAPAKARKCFRLQRFNERGFKQCGTAHSTKPVKSIARMLIKTGPSSVNLASAASLQVLQSQCQSPTSLASTSRATSCLTFSRTVLSTFCMTMPTKGLAPLAHASSTRHPFSHSPRLCSSVSSSLIHLGVGSNVAAASGTGAAAIVQHWGAPRDRGGFGLFFVVQGMRGGATICAARRKAIYHV